MLGLVCLWGGYLNKIVTHGVKTPILRPKNKYRPQSILAFMSSYMRLYTLWKESVIVHRTEWVEVTIDTEGALDSLNLVGYCLVTTLAIVLSSG
jgi:hypothetical protein